MCAFPSFMLFSNRFNMHIYCGFAQSGRGHILWLKLAKRDTHFPPLNFSFTVQFSTYWILIFQIKCTHRTHTLFKFLISNSTTYTCYAKIPNRCHSIAWTVSFIQFIWVNWFIDRNKSYVNCNWIQSRLLLTHYRITFLFKFMILARFLVWVFFFRIKILNTSFLAVAKLTSVKSLQNVLWLLGTFQSTNSWT